MTLGDDLRQMSLNNSRDSPVTEAAKKGKAPTLLDVKKSVKAPINYEPPHFQAGDEEKDKWYFMTHDLDEVPDKWSIGKVNTGHHSVNLSVTSIATYLPSSSTPHNNAAFGGTTMKSPPAPNLTPAQEASIRAAQAEQQIIDAQTRNVAWSGDESVEFGDADGEGEDDPEYMRLPDGTYKRIASAVPEVLVPSGIRNSETGNIEPLCVPMDVEETHFAGVSEKLPTKLNELNLEKANETSNMEQTQVVEDLFTHDVPMPSLSPDRLSPTSSLTADPIFHSSSSGSAWSAPSASPATSSISRQGSDIDMDMLKDLQAQPSIDETVSLDMETQVEPIESFGDETVEQVTEGDHITPRRTGSSDKKTIPRNAMSDNGLQCDCGIDEHLATFLGGCLPDWKEKARIVILIEIGPPHAGPYGTGFLVQQTKTLDDLGFPQTEGADSNNKARHTKQPKPRKNVQTKSFIFNREALRDAKYADYFNPDPAVESRILKLKEMASRMKSLKIVPNSDLLNTAALHLAKISLKGPVKETQTQAETQTIPYETGLKRNIPADDNDSTPKPKKKKMKISVTHGLDLAE
ncbi:hypothetical protein H0H87_011818 [Tephrocybe sp. NHM501043]|nr:hypothetical protein H0H87_011818 [Tephrocybe sp. NHM501043]